MKDSLGLRGFAQVIPNQGNIYAMSSLAEQKRQSDRDYQLKKEQQDLDWFTQSSKLDFANVRTELQKGLMEQFKATNNAMQSIYQQSISNGGLDSGSRQAITELKSNYDSMKNIAESFNKDLTGVNDVIKADKDLFNESIVATKMSDLMQNAFQRDGQGNIVGFNFESATGVSDLLSDPDVYNLNEMGKRFTGSLSTIENEIISSGATADVFTTEKYSPLFETEKTKDGYKLKRDPDTGNPIPKATPESLKMWDDQGKEYKNKLTSLAEKDGITRSEAFKKYIVEPFAKVTTEKSKTNKPEWMVNLGKEKDDEKLLANAIQGVFSQDKAALQLFNNIGNGIEVKYRTETPGEQVTKESNGLPVPASDLWNKQDKRYVDVFKKILVKDQSGYLYDAAMLDSMLKSGSKLMKEGNREYIQIPVDSYDLSDYESTVTGLTRLLTENGVFKKDLTPRIYKQLKEQQPGKFNDY